MECLASQRLISGRVVATTLYVGAADTPKLPQEVPSNCLRALNNSPNTASH
jgi:hypothetical protein